MLRDSIAGAPQRGIDWKQCGAGSCVEVVCAHLHHVVPETAWNWKHRQSELAQRVKDFLKGRWLSLLSQTSNNRRSVPTQRATKVEEEQEKRGRATQAKIQMGPVSRAGTCCQGLCFTWANPT